MNFCMCWSTGLLYCKSISVWNLHVICYYISKWPGLELWPGSLHCVLGQGALLLQHLSPTRNINGYRRNPVATWQNAGGYLQWTSTPSRAIPFTSGYKFTGKSSSRASNYACFQGTDLSQEINQGEQVIYFVLYKEANTSGIAKYHWIINFRMLEIHFQA